METDRPILHIMQNGNKIIFGSSNKKVAQKLLLTATGMHIYLLRSNDNVAAQL